MRSKLTTLASLSLAMTPLVSQAEAEEITIWAWDPNFNIAIMEEAKARYLQQNPDVTFNIIVYSKDDVEQKLLTNLASGVTRSLPDIVLIEDYKAQNYLQSFPGSFERLDDDIDMSDFAPYKVSLATVDGASYSVPFDTGVTGMFYRSDVLAEAGFGAQDLEDITWDEFIEIGKVVKEKTGMDIISVNTAESGFMRMLMHSANTWFFNEAGELNLRDNAGLEATLNLYRDLHASGVARSSTGWSEWVSGVSQGDVATAITGVWFMGTIKSLDQPGQWAVAPTPRLSGVDGAANASNWGGSSWYVMSSSDTKEEAIDFLRSTFASDVDFYQKILVERGAVGSYLPSQAGTAYVEGDAYFGGQPVFEDFAAWSAMIPAIDFGTYTYEVSDALVAQVPGLLRGMSVDEAITNAEAQVAGQIQ
ncbi:MAG: extracellular solute-binding protein [Saccharospirillum sp.]|uniref:extracellular solute-binding protein n=1 Tax=Saccharospirillum sp. TaxID=2033801 RepID=UPI00329725BD